MSSGTQTLKANSSKSSKFKKHLAEKIRENQAGVAEWYLEHTRKAPPPFYSSIDLRDSGYKIVPVDTNLYPAGFNNICPADLRTAPSLFRSEVTFQSERNHRPIPKRILILPESHTQNLYYLENLHYLTQISQQAGFETQIGWYSVSQSDPTQMNEDNTSPILLKSFTGKELCAKPLVIQGGVASAGQFVPDLILCNNDFSGGYPTPLDSINAITQPILPSHALGWHTRKKSEHFHYYNQLAQEFADLIQIDPWLIQIDTEEVAPVHFGANQGIEEVAAAVSRVLSRTQDAYTKHQVDRKPFAFVKNNAGTYGMGIMVAHSPEDILRMNRRTKTKMSMGKNQRPIESVVVQEGVPTTTLVDRLAAEPVIYLFGGQLMGGFLRTNTEKGIEDNLNSQGMVFKKLCMSDLRDLEDIERETAEGGPSPISASSSEPTLEIVYGWIARISALATGMELLQHGLRGLRDSRGAHKAEETPPSRKEPSQLPKFDTQQL